MARIGRSKTTPNVLNEQQHKEGKQQQQQVAAPAFAKLRKPAKIMDMMSRTGLGTGNYGGGTQHPNGRKPAAVDDQRLLLFEEELNID